MIGPLNPHESKFGTLELACMHLPENLGPSHRSHVPLTTWALRARGWPDRIAEAESSVMDDPRYPGPS